MGTYHQVNLHSISSPRVKINRQVASKIKKTEEKLKNVVEGYHLEIRNGFFSVFLQKISPFRAAVS